MRLPLALGLCLTALPAHAVLPPCAYDDLVSAATDVVQLEALSLREDGPNDMCQMEGNVIASFRGRFEIGQRLRFSVPCDIDRPPLLGPTIYHATDALDAANWVEVHFNDQGEIAGHGDGLVVLEAPTEEIFWRPYCQ